jgi:hypothetical protein
MDKLNLFLILGFLGISSCSSGVSKNKKETKPEKSCVEISKKQLKSYFIDCTKPKPLKFCCKSSSIDGKKCEKREKQISTGYELKCKLKVPAYYVACGCGCCEGVKVYGKKCIYFGKGEDIRKIIKSDLKKGRNECEFNECESGIRYEYCDK